MEQKRRPGRLLSERTSEPGPASGRGHQLLDDLQDLHGHREESGGAAGLGQTAVALPPPATSSLSGATSGLIP